MDATQEEGGDSLIGSVLWKQVSQSVLEGVRKLLGAGGEELRVAGWLGDVAQGGTFLCLQRGETGLSCGSQNVSRPQSPYERNTPAS